MHMRARQEASLTFCDIKIGLHWKYVNVIFEGVGMDFNATVSQPWYELPYLRPPCHDRTVRLLSQLVNLEDCMLGIA